LLRDHQYHQVAAAFFGGIRALENSEKFTFTPTQNGLNKFEFGDDAVAEVAAVCEGSGLRELSGECFFDDDMLWRVVCSRTELD
jgi:hypothetical protein